MKKLLIQVVYLIILSYGCKPAKERNPSQNYLDIKEFVKEANINDKEVLFFYSAKPRFPLPNVYCFNHDGVQLNAPPQCFQYISDYVRLLNDSIVPIKSGSETLQHFLDSTAILNVYGEVINGKSFPGYDYYLFVDYVAIPIESMKATLNSAKSSVDNSRKKIKLFLVHAISQSNKAIYKSEAEALKDSGKTK